MIVPNYRDSSSNLCKFVVVYFARKDLALPATPRVITGGVTTERMTGKYSFNAW